MGHEFCRGSLKAVKEELRGKIPPRLLKNAWVHKCTSLAKPTFEFHIPKCPDLPQGHYWSGQACCRWHAKALGWQDYMQKWNIGKPRCKSCEEELVSYGGAGMVCTNPECENTPEVLKEEPQVEAEEPEVKKEINYAGVVCSLREEVDSIDSAQGYLDACREEGIKACCLHENGKHQIYVEKLVCSKSRKEIAEKYFSTFGEGIGSVYAEGNMGIITLLSDLQHEVAFNFENKEKANYWRGVLNDIKCTLSNDDKEVA